MATVTFTPNLERHLQCPPIEAHGATVGAVLEAALHKNQRLSNYIFDDQGRLRKHVVVFVDGRPVSDRKRLSDPAPPNSEIYVMQALSGGQNSEWAAPGKGGQL